MRGPEWYCAAPSVGRSGPHHDHPGGATGGADIEAMTADELAAWGELCGWALARGHARSGDPATIATYIGTDRAFEAALVEFAARYADQTERDHAALVAAIASGRIVAATGM
jgi:hypothetical protein